MGSVSKYCMKNADCNVLITKGSIKTIDCFDGADVTTSEPQTDLEGKIRLLMEIGESDSLDPYTKKEIQISIKKK